MGILVTLEGPEGSGKSTQIALLRDALSVRGVPAHFTREPGGTEIGEQIRALLHDPRNRAMVAETEILLYSASRAQHVAEVIRPALARGLLVVSDRFSEATLAYQGCGRGLDLGELERITQFATGGLQPDLVLYLDIDIAIGLRRKRSDRSGEWNRMDQQSLDFHRRVRTGYLELARQRADHWLVIDGSLPIATIHATILEQVMALIGRDPRNTAAAHADPVPDPHHHGG